MEGSGHDEAIDMARRVIRTCLAGRVRQINRVVTSHYDRELAEVGITANQLTILSAVALLESVTPTDLMPYLLMEASTLSRNVKRMVAHRWLATIPGEDRRSHQLIVAPEGFRILAAVAPHWQKAHEWAEEALGDGDAVREMAHRLNPRVPR